MTPRQRLEHTRMLNRERQRRYVEKRRSSGLPTKEQVGLALIDGVREAICQYHGGVEDMMDDEDAPLKLVIAMAMRSLSRSKFDIKDVEVRRVVRNAVSNL